MHLAEKRDIVIMIVKEKTKKKKKKDGKIEGSESRVNKDKVTRASKPPILRFPREL